MKRYPLQTLVRLREHRTEAARQRVLERQREAQACRDACQAIEGEISALHAEQTQQRARMLDPPPPGVPWPNALAQREAHIDLLGEQAEAARQRLLKAQDTLRAAEAAVAEARTAFFRAQARLDALQKRRDVWRGEQSVLEARQEESASEDLLQARHLAGT
ncbi:hypothetical protein WCE41_08930 [Luteimonas sp. MJ246]|uniref:hypothetical protein n=1 Tax=Luteimonas sp. MJ174 TaxID=3129237 RepID=UPI0031BB10A1